MGQLLGKPARRVAPPPARTPAGHPLPDPLHKTVDVSQLPSGRLLIIGDVHGCMDELRQLLARCEYQSGHDALLFVGDLVNKGPQSLEVIDFVQGEGALVVRGNHDELAITAHGKLQRGEAVKAKVAWVSELSDRQLAYLQSLPFSLSLPQLRVLLVHAGMVPRLPLQQQQLADLFKMRDVVEAPASAGTSTRLLGSEERVEGGSAWATLWDGPQHVFFGHDAKRRLQLCKYATGLDTGCVYGGELTAAVLPPWRQVHELLQSCCQPEGQSPRAPTLKQLGGQIVSVPALRVHAEKKAKGAGKEDAEENFLLAGDEGEGGVDVVKKEKKKKEKKKKKDKKGDKAKS